MKTIGVEVAGAFVEHVGDHVADAGFVRGILGGAAGEGIFHRHQRHGGILHEPGYDAARRHQPLDAGGGMDPRCAADRKRGQCDGQPERLQKFATAQGHDRFSSRLVVSLTR